MDDLCDGCEKIKERLKEVKNNILKLTGEELERLSSIIDYQRRDDLGIECINCPGRYSEDIIVEVVS